MTEESVPNTLLRLLQDQYGQWWSIRRNGDLWVATTKSDRAKFAPTLIQENVELFVHQLEHPPTGIGNRELLRGPLNENESHSRGAENGLLEG